MQVLSNTLNLLAMHRAENGDFSNKPQEDNQHETPQAYRQNDSSSELSLARKTAIITLIPGLGILSVGWVLLEKYEDTTTRAVESAEALQTQGQEVVDSIEAIREYADENNLPELANNVDEASEDVATLVSILDIDPACLAYSPSSSDTIKIIENWCPED